MTREASKPPLHTGVVWLVALALAGAYRRRNLLSGLGEYRRVAAAGAVTVLGVWITADVTPEADIAWKAASLPLAWVTTLLCIGRLAVRSSIRWAASHGHRLDRVLVVGTSRHAASVAQQLHDNAFASAEVVGFLSDYVPVGTEVVDGLRVVGEPLQLAEIAVRLHATRALVVEAALSWESLDGMARVMQASPRLDVWVVPGPHVFNHLSLAPRQVGPVATLAPRHPRTARAIAALKRVVAGLGSKSRPTPPPAPSRTTVGKHTTEGA
jgi:MYXO-CTERM domain-containing protein